MFARASATLLIGLGLMLSAVASASAQTPVIVGPGGSVNQGRDCQVVRVCRVSADGTRRCNIGAYACRVCQFVEARCTVGSAKRVCRQALCTWG